MIDLKMKMGVVVVQSSSINKNWLAGWHWECLSLTRMGPHCVACHFSFPCRDIDATMTMCNVTWGQLMVPPEVPQHRDWSATAVAVPLFAIWGVHTLPLPHL